MTHVWSPATRAEVAARLSRPDLGRWLGQVQQVRHCAHPVRLVGASDTIDPATGEVARLLHLGGRAGRRDLCALREPAGVGVPVLLARVQGRRVACADGRRRRRDEGRPRRRSPRIRWCSPPSPRRRSGRSMRRRSPAGPAARRCLPRSGDRRQLCPHGRPALVHGRPRPRRRRWPGSRCAPDCYDYAGHLVWQWWAPELWRRFTITLRRRLAPHLGLSETAARRLVRVQFAKVAEFQRRGVIHFHALIRLDGATHRRRRSTRRRPSSVDSEHAGRARPRRRRGRVGYAAPPIDRDDQPRRLRFGAQLDARPVTGTADRDEPRRASCTRRRSPPTSRSTPPKPPPTSRPTKRRRTGTCAGSGPPLGQLAARAAIAGLHRREHPYRRLGSVGRHARLPRPLRHQVPPLLDHPRPAPPSPPRPRPPPHPAPRAEPAGWVDDDQADARDDHSGDRVLAVRRAWAGSPPETPPSPPPPPPEPATTDRTG